ncbi:hypothetical protein K443DRAFT_112218 [Laccaria amethystina LaAM-08-1]|uniref:Uncharacterized protein n=1 Tax=Laccaria amethystina LaAM-08-1 TaxID=1095629 RepID=A0A0C9XAL3_9AGAR|nr:hypothetical protein K443DRAFT_112218 [Laccaria amethystina LaAM-08-1]
MKDMRRHHSSTNPGRPSRLVPTEITCRERPSWCAFVFGVLAVVQYITHRMNISTL